MIADLPTQGLDIGATEFVRNKLIDAKENKACVLLISEDLDEILAVSDWIAHLRGEDNGHHFRRRGRARRDWRHDGGNQPD